MEIFIYMISLSLLVPCLTIPRQYRNKLTLADSAELTNYYDYEPEGPGTYSFGYDVEDSETGNVHFRNEQRSPNGTVSGSYGFVSPEGNVYVINYIADHLGYRTKIEEARKLNTINTNQKSLINNLKNISPQMLSALQSLEIQNNKMEKEDQRLRPISGSNLNLKDNTVYQKPYNENNQHTNHIYKSYFVPNEYYNYDH